MTNFNFLRSAGAGRTGTFIGLDICSQQLQQQSKVNYAECIYTMRKQRVQMIQNWVRTFTGVPVIFITIAIAFIIEPISLPPKVDS